MIKNYLLLLLLPTLSFGQIIYQEDFESYADKTGIHGENGYQENLNLTEFSNFTLNATDLEMNNDSNDYFYIDNMELRARDLDGEAVFEIDNIAVNGTDLINFQIQDIQFEPFTDGDFDGSEYIDVYYSLDGGSNVLIPFQDGTETTSGHTFANDGVLASDFDTSLDFDINPAGAGTIAFQIVFYCDGKDERFELDNFIVSQNSVTLWEQNFDTITDETGYIGNPNYPGIVFNEDYPVTNWTLTQSIIGFSNNEDYVYVDGNSSGTNQDLKFNDVNEEVEFETITIDITNVTDIKFNFNVETKTTSYESSDYVNAYYSLDNGATYTLFDLSGTGYTYVGETNIVDNAEQTYYFEDEIHGVSATQLKFKIAVDNNKGAEDFEIDNIVITDISTASVTENELDALSLYPNPAKTILNVDTLFQNGEIRITDITGKLVLRQVIESNTISIEHLENGTYFIQTINENKQLVKKGKLIKQ